MLRLLICLLLCGALDARCSPVDSAWVMTIPARENRFRVYAQLGYASELWTLSGKVTGAYSASSYTGRGSFLGAGITSFTQRPGSFGYGISLSLQQFTMQNDLNKNEQLPTAYSFIRLSPAGYYYFNPMAPLSMHLKASVNLLSSLHRASSSYVQAAIGAGARYSAYGLDVSYAFVPTRKGPVEAGDSFREQSVQISIICYPALIPGWYKVKNALRNR